MLKPFSPEDAVSFRNFLADAGHSSTGFSQRTIFRELPMRRTGNLPYLLDSTREPVLQNLLLRLFLFGIPVEFDALRSTTPHSILTLMNDAGLLVVEDNVATPQVMLSPCDELVFAADPLPRMEGGQISDIVLWPNRTTRILQWFAVRQPSRATLDLGSGCGVISVLASPYSERVVATDLNPRAAEFAAFNSRLNGVENIECYTGDTFENLDGRLFDQILANPPFFVTPSSSQLFCENPMDLDQYCRRVVRESACHLHEGGYLQMVFEWVQVRGQSWRDRLAEWLDGTNCDAWILRSYEGEPGAYAQERIRDEYATSPYRAQAKFDEWLAYYRKREVEAVLGGILAMRKRSGANWLRIEEMPQDASAAFGETIIDLFANQTILASHPSDDTLLALKPQLAAEAKLEQQFVLSGPKWALASLKLTLPGSLPSSMTIDSEVAGFLALCNGEQTLAQLAQDLAARVKVPIEVVQQQCCRIITEAANSRLVKL